MPDRLQKIINLVRKTGDKVVVFDSKHNDDFYVVLAQKDYEELYFGPDDDFALTDEELADKIGDDDQWWKTNWAKDSDGFDWAEDEDEAPDDEPVALNDRFEPLSEEEVDEIANATIEEAKKNWSIPEERKELAEEIIDEDRQYLEPIPQQTF